MKCEITPHFGALLAIVKVHFSSLKSTFLCLVLIVLCPFFVVEAWMLLPLLLSCCLVCFCTEAIISVATPLEL